MDSSTNNKMSIPVDFLLMFKKVLHHGNMTIDRSTNICFLALLQIQVLNVQDIRSPKNAPLMVNYIPGSLNSKWT